VISEEADGKGKRQAFEIRSFRYPPFRHDRGVEPYDFSFQIEPLFYYLPPIKFFYPPLRPGERAVTSLGNYRHPRLLDRPPDVANIEVPDVRSFKVDGAKRRLQILGLKTKTKSAGRPARRMDADRVTRQDPKPGTKVKTGTTVTLSHYTAYVPTRSELVRDMQRQCDRVKGAIAYWESRLNSPRCRCAKGMQLNRAKTACVKIRATTTSRRSTESGRSSGQRRSEPAWSCTDVLGEIRRRAGSGDRAGAARLADDPRTRAACPRGAIDQAMSAPAGYPRAGSRRDDTQARVQRARRCTAALAEIRKRTGRGDFLGATQVANDRRTREACPRREIDQALKTPARSPVSKSTSRRQTGTFTGCRWVALSRPGYGAGSAHECRCDQGTIRSTPQRFCGPQPRVVQPKRKAPSTTTTGRRPGTGGRLTPSNDKCFCKDPATGRYYEGLLGGCHGIESIDKKWCTPPPGAR